MFNPRTHVVIVHSGDARVDTARMPSKQRSLAALAAAVVGGASGSGGRATGSALYLLGSLLNHSCAPNLDVLFPAGNGAAQLRLLEGHMQRVGDVAELSSGLS